MRVLCVCVCVCVCVCERESLRARARTHTHTHVYASLRLLACTLLEEICNTCRKLEERTQKQDDEMPSLTLRLYQGLHRVYLRIRCTKFEALRGHGSVPTKIGCELGGDAVVSAFSSLRATVLCQAAI